MVQFSEANHVTAAATAIAVEQALVGVHQKAGLVIGVQRTQPQPAATARVPALAANPVPVNNPAAESAVLTRRELRGLMGFLPLAAEYGKGRSNPRQGWWAIAKRTCSFYQP